jgi:hypothetical protein
MEGQQQHHFRFKFADRSIYCRNMIFIILVAATLFIYLIVNIMPQSLLNFLIVAYSNVGPQYLTWTSHSHSLSMHDACHLTFLSPFDTRPLYIMLYMWGDLWQNQKIFLCVEIVKSEYYEHDFRSF